MCKQTMQFIKLVFIGVIIALALFAGSTQAVAVELDPISAAQLTCFDSKTTKNSIVTFDAEVVVNDAFCADAPFCDNDIEATRTFQR